MEVFHYAMDGGIFMEERLIGGNCPKAKVQGDDRSGGKASSAG
jgi:hypothetical protein